MARRVQTDNSREGSGIETGREFKNTPDEREHRLTVGNQLIELHVLNRFSLRTPPPFLQQTPHQLPPFVWFNRRAFAREANNLLFKKLPAPDPRRPCANPETPVPRCESPES